MGDQLNLCWQVSQLDAGEVSARIYTCADFIAWTPLAWLPGSGVATYYFGKGTGITLMFLVSVVAGQMLRGVLMRLQRVVRWRGEAAVLRDWRTWVTGGAVAGAGAGAGGCLRLPISFCGVGDDARVKGGESVVFSSW